MNLSAFLSWLWLPVGGIALLFYRWLTQALNDNKILRKDLTRQKRGSKIERENKENKQKFNHNELINFVSRRLSDDES